MAIPREKAGMLKRLLPNTTSLSLRVVIVTLCLVYLAQFLGCLRVASQMPVLWLALAFGIWLPMALGLWLMKNIARKVALGIHWLLFFAIPLGILNPFAAMDSPWIRQTPVWLLLGIVLVLGAGNYYVIVTLAKHKDQFHSMFRR